MENLNKANETLNKLKDSDVRVIYVPPMTVAAHYEMNEEEKKTAEKFLRESELVKIKPDVRLFTVFNCSIEDLKDVEIQSDQNWVSIPDDMEVSAPFTKKIYEGGLCAAYSGNQSAEGFHSLAEWVNESEKYEIDDGRPLFGECLNAYHLLKGDVKNGQGDLQGDLLIPIKMLPIKKTEE